MRALLFLAPVTLLALLAGCPPAGECQVDGDCDDGFACRETLEGERVCIQLLNSDAGPGGDVAVLTFAADPALVTAGGTSTLSWTTENARSCALSGGLGGVEPNGSLEVTVEDTREFALNCQGVNGPAVERIIVAVEVDITAFTATPADIDELGEVTLAWTTVGAESCQLTFGAQVDLDVDVNGSHIFVPTTGGDASLTCEGASGPSVSDQATIQLARVTALTVTPPAIAVGQSMTLAWTTENATACAIAGETDPDANDDALVVAPTSTQTYSLRCTGFQGELRRDAEAVVLITEWAPQAASVASGADAVFDFALDTRVSSCTLDDATVVDISTGSVTIPGITADVTHTMTCQDGDGLTATSESATVTVQ